MISVLALLLFRGYVYINCGKTTAKKRSKKTKTNKQKQNKKPKAPPPPNKGI
jgi:hypothetical protein